jgi:predicted nucleotidyltransferase
VRVFGSVAWGEADKNSDAHVPVDPDFGRILPNLGGLRMDLQDLLGCEVGMLTEPGLRWRARGDILKEAAPF